MLVLASASPRRRELLTQAGYSFEVHPADIPEDPLPNEDPVAYVTRLAREKAQAVYNELLGAPSDCHLERAERVEGPVSCNSGERVGSHEPLGAQAQLAAPQVPQAQLAPPQVAGCPRSLAFGDLGNHEPRLTSRRPLAPPQVVLGADTTVTLDNHILGKPENPADAARMLRLLSGRTHRVITGVALVTANRIETAAESTAVTFLALSDKDIADYVATREPMDKAGAYAIQGRAARWIPRIEGCYFNVVGLPIALVSTLLKSFQLADSPSL